MDTEQAKKDRANAKAKERRVKVKQIKELRAQAKEKAAVGALNDNQEWIDKAKLQMKEADRLEAELGRRAPDWELRPDGRWIRHIDLPDGKRIMGKIDPAQDGWIQGTVALIDGEHVPMTAGGAVADGEVELLKLRLNLMISGLRAVARKG